jgi:hypothetical protein
MREFYPRADVEALGDDVDLQEIYDTERQLLYVACTQARYRLLVTSGGLASEFLDDFQAIRAD